MGSHLPTVPVPGTGPGTYKLFVAEDSRPHYVGRADTNLKRRLDQQSKCPGCGEEIIEYEWWDLDTADEAYLQECRLFHRYGRKTEGGTLCNQNHPACPGPESPPCPVCKTCYR